MPLPIVPGTGGVLRNAAGHIFHNPDDIVRSLTGQGAVLLRNPTEVGQGLKGLTATATDLLKSDEAIFTRKAIGAGLRHERDEQQQQDAAGQDNVEPTVQDNTSEPMTSDCPSDACFTPPADPSFTTGLLAPAAPPEPSGFFESLVDALGELF